MLGVEQIVQALLVWHRGLFVGIRKSDEFVVPVMYTLPRPNPCDADARVRLGAAKVGGPDQLGSPRRSVGIQLRHKSVGFVVVLVLEQVGGLVIVAGGG